jgi:hypothetical protein
LLSKATTSQGTAGTWIKSGWKYPRVLGYFSSVIKIQLFFACSGMDIRAKKGM